MVKLALIGKDLSYSRSRQMHKFIAKKLNTDILYDYFSLSQEEFDSTVEKIFNNYDGFNITVPYKETIISKLLKLNGDAKTYASVNTVLTREKIGYNTDGDGFMQMLRSENINTLNKKVLVLGSGGAAKSCVYKLSKSGADVFVYNRTFDKVKELHNLYGGFTPLETISGNFDIIVNATSIGMTTQIGQMPIGEKFIKKAQTLVDLIYQPKVTAFLQCGKDLGKKILNGEKMLFFQAYYADMIYFNLKACDKQANDFFVEYIKEAENEV